MFARLEVGGEHHRARVVQPPAVLVVQIHAFVVFAVDADLQHTGIRPGKYVGPDRVACELDRYLAAGLVCTQEFHSGKSASEAAGDVFPVRHMPFPAVAALGQAGREESSIEKTGGIDRLDR